MIEASEVYATTCCLYETYKFRSLWIRNNEIFTAYCKKLKLGIRFHDKSYYIHYTNRPISVFMNKWKLVYDIEEFCNDNDIKLIIVPYNIKLSRLRQYILDKILL